MLLVIILLLRWIFKFLQLELFIFLYGKLALIRKIKLFYLENLTYNFHALVKNNFFEK